MTTKSKKPKMGRPPNKPGERVHRDWLHIGLRLSPEEKRMMHAVMAAKRKAVPELADRVTVSALAKVWIAERLLAEYKSLAPTAGQHLEAAAKIGGGS